VLGVLLLLQTAAPCSAAPLCQLLEAAAAVNARAMLTPGGYTATIETETSTLARREGRIEGASLIEQSSSEARWSSDGVFQQHVTGSRSFPNAIPLSKLALLRIGWIAPTLVGERLQVISRTGPGDTEFDETLVGPLAPEIVVHPLASDRDKYYRYSGGETINRLVDGISRPVIAIGVSPILEQRSEETLFDGEMELDPETRALVRLFGRLVVVGRQKRGGLFSIDLQPTVTLVDLINQKLPDGSWVPLAQRFEIQAVSSRVIGHGAARRVLSRFYAAAPIQRHEGMLAISASTSGYLLTSATSDSLRRFDGWFAPAGKATDSVSQSDFNRFRPASQQPTGPPTFAIQGFHRGDFVRFNRVEGLFTGLSGVYRLRDRAPGVYLRASGGYAWSEKTGRGAAGIGWDLRRWSLDGGVARTLEVTNEFRNQFDNPTTAALIGRDSWDYVDHRSAGISATRAIRDASGSILRFEAARVSDRQVQRHLTNSLFGATFRENRNITPGSYWRTRALLDWNPDVSPLFALDGIGFQAQVENGTGDLDYTRVEGRVVVRKSFNRVFVIAKLQGGALFSDNPPPQQLFELGGSVGLPGYEYKEFAGTRSALFRIRLSYPIGMLDVPFRIGSGITLPSLAPAISIGYQTGFADATTPAALAAVRALGDRHPDDGATLVDPGPGPHPASVPISRPVGSVDIRIGFFGDALAVGLARAIQRGRKTRLVLAFGRQF
jgi:hypothetical protein